MTNERFNLPKAVQTQSVQPSSSEFEFFGFSKDESVKTVSLDLLKKSVRVEGKHGRALQTRPVQSWTLMLSIIQMLESNDINYKMDDIYVAKKTSHPRINDRDKSAGYGKEVCPINKWEFDKLITSFSLPNLGNDVATGRIALSFYDKGISVAFGTNVKVCSNFSILGGNIIRTFTHNGRPGVSWESMESIIWKWLQQNQQIMKVETTIMKRMMEAQINSEDVIDKVIGDLYQKAIKQAYLKGKDAPFDTHGMSQFVREMLDQRKEEEKIGNVWDLYNWGTSIMKPDRVDLSDIIESSKLFADYLCLEFAIEREDLFAEAEIVE